MSHHEPLFLLSEHYHMKDCQIQVGLGPRERKERLVIEIEIIFISAFNSSLLHADAQSSSPNTAEGTNTGQIQSHTTLLASCRHI